MLHAQQKLVASREQLAAKQALETEQEEHAAALQQAKHARELAQTREKHDEMGTFYLKK